MIFLLLRVLRENMCAKHVYNLCMAIGEKRKIVMLHVLFSSLVDRCVGEWRNEVNIG